MKQSFYFPHYLNARNDEKILQLRAEFGLSGYALYFMILESMAEADSGIVQRKSIPGLCLSYGSAKQQLLDVFDFCIEIQLFIEDESGIYSKRMLEHISFRTERSKSGKKGSNKRWGKIAEPLAEDIAEPMQINKRNKEINKKEIIKTECDQIFTLEELAELEKPF